MGSGGTPSEHFSGLQDRTEDFRGLISQGLYTAREVANPCARRSVDTRSLTFRAVCVEDLQRSSIDTPWVGVGPSTSRALAFVASEGKTLPSGMCEASAAVRYLDVTLCPVSSFADLCVAEFSNAARLRVEHLEKAFVLRAPSGLGHSVLSATTSTKRIGACLRAAGVQCDLSEKGASGKATVTHQCKKFAVAQAALVNVDYDKITHIASHERNVTKQHYMTICHDALHRIAGCLCRICQPRLRSESVPLKAFSV
ncbi:hypothetical protein WJX72_006860 [[Myrmecia] bisecta]|uniref:Uncharacterized protein n=1 Tax=[Myrmecia] bisecta TaxID=41462 RepID=A0AAW1Q4I4_9CHLO